MSTGMSPLLMLDLASTRIADHQRGARDRGQQAVARRGRRSPFTRTR